MEEIAIYGRTLNNDLIQLAAVEVMSIAGEDHILFEVVGEQGKSLDRLFFRQNKLIKIIKNSGEMSELYQVLEEKKAGLKLFIMTVLYSQIERFDIKEITIDYPII